MKSLKIAPQIADAIAAAQSAGIIHRDLKPSNVMVTKSGLVKVLDFGLAKLSGAAQGTDAATLTMPRTDSGMVVGTFGYMSPEQLRGRDVDRRSDIFNFGTPGVQAVNISQQYRRCFSLWDEAKQVAASKRAIGGRKERDCDARSPARHSCASVSLAASEESRIRMQNQNPDNVAT